MYDLERQVGVHMHMPQRLVTSRTDGHELILMIIQYDCCILAYKCAMKMCIFSLTKVSVIVIKKSTSCSLALESISVLVLMFRFHMVLAEKCCFHHRDEAVGCDLLLLLCALLNCCNNVTLVL